MRDNRRVRQQSYNSLSASATQKSLNRYEVLSQSIACDVDQNDFQSL